MYILFIIFFSELVFSQDPELLFYAQKINSLQDQYQCQNISPFHHFHYGYKKVIDQGGIFFCDQYSRRTCCSEDNFNEVKLKWLLEYQQADNVSPACQETFSKLACYDCDGDVGQGLRHGLCPNFCIQLYRNCFYDQFQWDEKTKKLRFCKKTDIFCSELRYIYKNPQDINGLCKSIGYEVNEYTDFEEWIDNLLINTTVKTPACWDSTPSSRFFGKALSFNQAEFSDRIKKGRDDLFSKIKKQTNFYGSGFYISLGILVFILAGIVYFIYFRLNRIKL